jgi:hypothetical protein
MGNAEQRGETISPAGAAAKSAAEPVKTAQIGSLDPIPANAIAKGVCDLPVLQNAPIEIRQSIEDLLDGDYQTSIASLTCLTLHGSLAASTLLEIARQTDDPYIHGQICIALEEIGRLSVEPLAAALEGMTQFTRDEHITLCGCLAESLVRIEEKRAAPMILKLIKRLNDAAAATRNENMKGKLESAAMRLHCLLGDFGVKEGVDELLKAIGDGRKRVHEDIVEALAKVGDRRAIQPLIRLHTLESGITEVGGRLTKWAVREIMRREKLTRDDPFFQTFLKEDAEIIEKMQPKPRTQGKTNGNGADKIDKAQTA